MDSSENDWRAREDMQTLMRAEAINRDPKRLAAARKAAKKKLEEQVAETAVVKRLANAK